MDSKTQQEVERRLKSVEGHVRGIMRMVDEDRPCVAVIHQIQAAQASLKRAQAIERSGVMDRRLECLQTGHQTAYIKRKRSAFGSGPLAMQSLSFVLTIW